MNGIIYYSNTNQSKAVAEYCKNELAWDIYDLNQPKQTEEALLTSFEKVILIFPIYCQNIPDIVKSFLKKLNARYLTVIATYGKMCYGRVLYEVQKIYTSGDIVAAAYIPMKHSYLCEDTKNDFSKLFLLLQKVLKNQPEPIIIKKTYKNLFANLAKDMRSRIILKITFEKSKCTNCRKCESECLFNGIKNGKTNKKCIRCLKCVTNCPSGALSFRKSLPLRIYLKKKPVDKFVLYI